MPHQSCPKARHRVKGDDPMVAEAIRSMENALDMFDRAGLGTTAFACHLSMAIDCAQSSFDDAAASLLKLLKSDKGLLESESLH
jgi:enolase